MTQRIATVLAATATLLLLNCAAPAYVVATGTPPSAPLDGDRWTDTDSGTVKEWDGSHWVPLVPQPPEPSPGDASRPEDGMKEWTTSDDRKLRSEDTGAFGWRWLDSPYAMSGATTSPFALPNHIHFGGQVVITGSGLEPDYRYGLSYTRSDRGATISLGSAVTDSSGSFSVSLGASAWMDHGGAGTLQAVPSGPASGVDGGVSPGTDPADARVGTGRVTASC